MSAREQSPTLTSPAWQDWLETNIFGLLQSVLLCAILFVLFVVYHKQTDLEDNISDLAKEQHKIAGQQLVLDQALIANEAQLTTLITELNALTQPTSAPDTSAEPPEAEKSAPVEKQALSEIKPITRQKMLNIINKYNKEN